jgi:uncharacterized tellurite resistance protein B-like protein
MRHKRILKRKLIYLIGIMAMVLVATFLLCDVLEARAGGGHNFSSRSRSSGGGGGGGVEELIVRILFELIRLSFHYPAIGIPLLITFCVVLYFFSNKANDTYVDSVISKGSKLIPDADNISTINSLRGDDPTFNAETFKTRLQKAFADIQSAWTNRDLSGVEHFLSDGIYEQFSIQLDEYKRDHIIDHLEGLKIKSLSFLKYEKDNVFSTIHVAIHAEGINYRKSDIDNKFIDGSYSVEPFAEVWTFVRKSHVKSQDSKGSLLEGNCPNCGNPIRMGRLAKCEICGSFLRSGEHDWVLTKITQRSEWRGVHSSISIPGYEKYKEEDPGFNIQNIEDKVSVMFWRRNIAAKLQDTAFLRKISTNEYCDHMEKLYKPDLNDEYTFYKNCGVGSITLKGIGSFPSVDIALVEVLWAGRLATIFNASNFNPSNPNSSKSRIKLAGVQHFREIFILIRSPKAKTPMEKSLSSAHCPNCGAPEATSKDNECQYCGTVMNSGETSWVLKDVLFSGEPKVREMITTIRNLVTAPRGMAVASTGSAKSSAPAPTYSPEYHPDEAISSTELILWAIAMMLADGHLDQRELKYLELMGNQYGLSQRRITQLIEEVRSHADPVVYVMSRCAIKEPRKLIRHLIAMALADGKITKEEQKMLISVASKAGIREAEFKAILNDERKKQYKAATEAMQVVKRATW